MRGHNATTMFARFHPSLYRLQVSIVETRRLGGKVRHEHIASLGSIETPLSVANQVAFWHWDMLLTAEPRLHGAPTRPNDASTPCPISMPS
jgi:hypothetical protein